MSRAKLWKTKTSKVAKFLLIFVIIIAWIFSGWPQIWQEPPIPPKVRVIEAAVAISVADGTVAYGLNALNKHSKSVNIFHFAGS
jgi:hypothetical protein